MTGRNQDREVWQGDEVWWLLFVFSRDLTETRPAKQGRRVETHENDVSFC